MYISHSVMEGQRHNNPLNMPGAVNYSGFYDKHNCPQRDLISGPRTLQSGMLLLDYCDLLL